MKVPGARQTFQIPPAKTTYPDAPFPSVRQRTQSARDLRFPRRMALPWAGPGCGGTRRRSAAGTGPASGTDSAGARPPRRLALDPTPASCGMIAVTCASSTRTMRSSSPRRAPIPTRTSVSSRSTTRRRRPAAGSGSRASSRSWKAACTARRSSARSCAGCPSDSTTRTGSRTRTSTSNTTSATSRCRRRATGASSASRPRASTRARSIPTGRCGRSTSSRASTASSTCPKDSFALLTKLHHAAIDVERGTEIITLLHDTTPQPPKPEPPEPWFPDSPPSALELVCRGVVHTATSPRATRAPDHERARPRWAPRPARSRASCCRGSESIPVTRFNTVVSPYRVFETRRFLLDEFREIRRLVPGATVNDAVLAVCAGGLRNYLEANDELPEQDLSALTPVYVRDPQAGPGARPEVEWVRLMLGVAIADPVRRLAFVKAQTAASQAHVARDRRARAHRHRHARSRRDAGAHRQDARPHAARRRVAARRSRTARSPTCPARRFRST